MKNKILILTIFITSITNLKGIQNNTIYEPYSIFEQLSEQEARERSKWLKKLIDNTAYTQNQNPSYKLNTNSIDQAINEIIILKNQNAKQIKDKRKPKRIYIYPEIFEILNKYNLCSGVNFTNKFWKLHPRGTKLTWKCLNKVNPEKLIILDKNKIEFNESLILTALNTIKKSKNYRKGLSKFICNIIEHCQKTITSNTLNIATGYRLIEFN